MSEAREGAVEPEGSPSAPPSVHEAARRALEHASAGIGTATGALETLSLSALHAPADGDPQAGQDARAARRFASVRRSVGALEDVLLQGERQYSRRDLAERQDIPERLTATYWRSLGFTPVDEDRVIFTEEDATAIGDLVSMVEAGVLSQRSFTSISRGLGYHMGRLAMWITEALVDEAKAAHHLDDVAAREHMLGVLPQMVETLEAQVLYTFRRQLAAYAARAGSEVLHAEEGAPHDEVFPLQRAVGFADLVQFTRLSRSLGGAELADVVGRFEVLCRDIISVGGGRVVKTVGDEIMFLADTPEDGVQIAVSIAEAIRDDPELPPVRLGLCWGSMFSRYGDVFGPTVNLAARLESVAEQGTVLVDEATADAVAEMLPGGFREVRRETVDLHGIGPVGAVVLDRGAAAPLDMGL